LFPSINLQSHSTRISNTASTIIVLVTTELLYFDWCQLRCKLTRLTLATICRMYKRCNFTKEYPLQSWWAQLLNGHCNKISYPSSEHDVDFYVSREVLSFWNFWVLGYTIYAQSTNLNKFHNCKSKKTDHLNAIIYRLISILFSHTLVIYSRLGLLLMHLPVSTSIFLLIYSNGYLWHKYGRKNWERERVNNIKM